MTFLFLLNQFSDVPCRKRQIKRHPWGMPLMGEHYRENSYRGGRFAGGWPAGDWLDGDCWLDGCCWLPGDCWL